MSSPYRIVAIISSGGSSSSIPPGQNTISDEEYELLLAGLPPKIYEPVMIGGELVLITDGDCLVDWGGEYAT